MDYLVSKSNDPLTPAIKNKGSDAELQGQNKKLAAPNFVLAIKIFKIGKTKFWLGAGL